jgi:hypothetical protein
MMFEIYIIVSLFKTVTKLIFFITINRLFQKIVSFRLYIVDIYQITNLIFDFQKATLSKNG